LQKHDSFVILQERLDEVAEQVKKDRLKRLIAKHPPNDLPTVLRQPIS
jgi:hypothetical protein